MNRKYDLIFGIGTACSCSDLLRHCGLQRQSFPFDWVSPEPNDVDGCTLDLSRRIDLLCQDFADLLRKEDLSFIHRESANRKDAYLNRTTLLVHNHDFEIDLPFEIAFPNVKTKYERRAKRLLTLIRKSRRVLLVRVDRPDQVVQTPSEECLSALKRLSGHFPGVQFEMVLFRHDPDCISASTANVGDALVVHSLNYLSAAPDALPFSVDFGKLVPFLEGYAVREYRTLSERRARRARKRLAKMAALGISSRWQYWLYKCFRMPNRHKA